MHNLTPRQTALLAHALANGGQLFPLPAPLGPLGLARRSITPLLRRKLLAEVGVQNEVSAWRVSGDQYYGLMLTSLGRSLAMPIVDDSGTEDASSIVPKIGRVHAMLARKRGVALAEIVAATGWQPHSARAALTGLRRKGLTILLSEIDGERRYRLLEAA